MINERAFPNPHWTDATGMTLRDYFAAKAMLGILNCFKNPKEFTEKSLAEESYAVADAMMEARK